MTKTWKYALAVCLALGIAGTATASPDIKTGLWENTVISEVEGMPFAPPPVTFKDCVTEEDLVPSFDAEEQGCDVMEYEIKGNTIRWRMECAHEGTQTRGQGEIRYRGDNYTGEMTMTMSGDQVGEIRMKQSLSGRYLGECK